MNIVEMNIKNITREEAYNLTSGRNSVKLSKAVGDNIEVNAYCIYEEDGSEIIAIKDTNGTCYASNSKTFIKEFEKMMAFFNDKLPLTITVMEGESRSGRNFIYCVLA